MAENKQNLPYLLALVLLTVGCTFAFVLTWSGWVVAVWMGTWIGLGVFRYGAGTIFGAWLASRGPNPSKYDDAEPRR